MICPAYTHTHLELASSSWFSVSKDKRKAEYYHIFFALWFWGQCENEVIFLVFFLQWPQVPLTSHVLGLLLEAFLSFQSLWCNTCLPFRSQFTRHFPGRPLWSPHLSYCPFFAATHAPCSSKHPVLCCDHLLTLSPHLDHEPYWGRKLPCLSQEGKSTALRCQPTVRTHIYLE